MQIHELNTFSGTPSATDYLAIDDGTETNKVPATNLGVTTQMTRAEAEAGTLTDPRVISPSVFKSSMIDIFYPVGSYYETSDTAFDPNTAWGGTWVQEISGQVHVSAGTGYSVSGANTNTSDGGEKTHTLTVDEMPSHTHRGQYGSGTGTEAGMSGVGTKHWFSSGYIEATGGGQAHNNMQPYIVVNRWHRTA